MFEFLRALIILLIAVPFLYMMFDVLFDITKRLIEVLAPRLVPARARSAEKRHKE